MAKFCTKCGKALEDGKACNCETIKTVEKKEVNNTDFVGMLKEYVEVVKSFMKKPIDTLKENISDNKFNIALISTVAFGIAMGIFMMVFFKEVMAGLGALMSFGGLYGLGSIGSVEVPYFKIFMISLVVAVVFIALMAGVAYLISEKLLKGKTSFKKMAALFGFSSIITTVALLAAALCMFIDIRLALVVLVAGTSLNTYYNFKGLEFATKTNVNQLGYILMPTTLIVAFVIGFIVPKIFS